jgi:hypothetical protein
VVHKKETGVVISSDKMCVRTTLKPTFLDRWYYQLKILDSHGGEDVDVGLLGCNTVWTSRKIPPFQKNILPPSPDLEMEAACSLVSTYKFTWRYNPEDHHRQLYRRENLKFEMIRTFYSKYLLIHFPHTFITCKPHEGLTHISTHVRQ